MKSLCLSLFTIAVITGCTSQTAHIKCMSNHCDRAVSSPTQVVIWWGPALQDPLSKDPESTTYDLNRYD